MQEQAGIKWAPRRFPLNVAGSTNEVLVVGAGSVVVAGVDVLERLSKGGVATPGGLHAVLDKLEKAKGEAEAKEAVRELAAFLPCACNVRSTTGGGDAEAAPPPTQRSSSGSCTARDACEARGATLLHSLVRAAAAGERVGPALHSWLGETVWTPVADDDGQTALHLCVERQRKPAARTLLRRLTPQLNAPQGALLTAALRSMAAKMPDLVPEALQTIEPQVLLPQRAFKRGSARRSCAVPPSRRAARPVEGRRG